MKTIISTKNISLDKPLEVFIEDKIGGLAKYLKDDAIQVRVEIGKPSKHHRNGEIFRAEANLKMGSNLLRAEAESSDLRTAIVEVKNKLQQQIKKFKDK